MADYNANYWEIPVESEVFERVSADRALWFETEEDRQRREAMREFFSAVAPVIDEMIDCALTERQREVIRLYYYYGKTQEEIATILNLSQSTVSRHLFGTARAGKKVGGALSKRRKSTLTGKNATIDGALEALRNRLAQPAA